MALQLNDSTALINRIANLVQGNSDWCMGVWIQSSYVATPPDYITCFSKQDAGFTKWAGLYANPTVTDNRILLSANNGSGEDFTIPDVAIRTDLVHLAYRKSGNTHSLYRNGVLIASITMDMSAVSFVEMTLGNDHTGLINGPIKFFDFFEYNNAKSVATIQAQMFSVGTLVDATNIVTFTPLTANLLDISGNGNHWTGAGNFSFITNPTVTSSGSITSAAGATLTKIHYTGATNPVWVAITSQSYCCWLKIPSIGVNRTLFDHDGKVTIKHNAAGKIELWIDGALAGTGNTVWTPNKWTFWSYKKTAANLHTVKICELNCVNNNPVLGTQVTEISVTQAFAPGDPVDFTLHIPAGCSLCDFVYGGDNTDVSTSRSSWGASPANFMVWMCPLRFPNDLYDHRAISAFAGDTTFNGMHNWTSQTGTISINPSGVPEHLLDKSCIAVIGIYRRNPPFVMEPVGGIVPALSTVVANFPVPFVFNSDTLPTNALVDSLTISGFVTITEPPPPRIYATYGNRWTMPGGLPIDKYTTHGNNFINYYVWNTLYGAPDHAVPFPLNDLFNSTFEALNKFENTGGAPVPSVAVNIYEIGIAVFYRGIAAACGAGAQAPVGTIIVDKIVLPDNGEEFEYNAVGLTPNAFSIDGSELQQYNNVPVGSGYGINEIVPSGWTVSYEVSNGSPHDNITVGTGETVVVTVTNIKQANNMSGIYKVVPGKRQDTLWLEGFTGERDTKIP